jgi:hypothetical protein
LTVRYSFTATDFRVGRYDDALCVGHEVLDGALYDVQTLHNLALTHYRKLELD